MFSDRPVPKNIIRLDKIKYAERPIDGQIRYTPDLGKDTTSRLIMASSLDRLCCVPNGCELYVLDTFAGRVIKTLMPPNPADISMICACVYLSQIRAFLIYQMPCQTVKATIVSLDIENGIYDFVGSPQLLLSFYRCVCCDFIRRDFVVLVKNICDKDNFYIFSIDPLSFELKSCRTMTVPQESCLFGSVDGKCIFAKVLFYSGYSRNLGNFTLIEKDDSLVEIKNTDVKVEILTTRHASGSCESVEGSWHENKLFALFSCPLAKRLSDDFLHPFAIISTILLFEFDTKTWSKIHLELPSNRIYYHLNVDDNAMLNLVIFGRVNENVDETFELRASAIRIPLGKPDKLRNLCWFRARDSNLSANLIQFKICCSCV